MRLLAILSLTVAAAAPAQAPASQIPNLVLIGDSTVRNGLGNGAKGQWGWGDPLANHFDSAKIHVLNEAVGGMSSRTYLTLGHWSRALALVKRGDFVIMQFGHNDGEQLEDPARSQGCLKGTGDEVRNIINPVTRQREVVHTYGWYLKKFIADSRARGATPIVCSLVPRKMWTDGKIVRDSAGYRKWAAEVAASERVGFIDLNGKIADRYDLLGPAKVDALFADPITHTSRAGAELNAQIVVAGLKSLAGNPLGPYFKAGVK
jgi:lysophospholipase L1-like esterase